MKFEKGYSYDDLLLQPQRSPVDSRSNVSTESNLIGDITIDVPIISAPMDTVTECEMAMGMNECGATGIIHRFLDPDEQAAEVEEIDGLSAGTIGIGEQWGERAQLLEEAGADYICLDIAHGHMEKCLEIIDVLSNESDVPIMAGNVATAEGACDVLLSGADSVKVGIGPGSHCLTREVTGFGVPQATAIQNVHEGILNDNCLDRDDYTIVADGGIQNSGDIVKALALGADTVMIGGLLGGSEESPGSVIEVEGTKYKKTRGMASEEARDKNNMETQAAVEGAEGYTKYTGSVETTIEKLASGIRSGFSYAGSYNVKQLRQNAEFIYSPSTQHRNGTHGTYVNRK